MGENSFYMRILPVGEVTWYADNSKLFSLLKMRAVSEEAQEELTALSDYALISQLKLSRW